MRSTGNEATSGPISRRMLPTIVLAVVHGDDAFAAAPGDPIFVRRRALAEAALRHGEHELFGRPHLFVTLLAELYSAGGFLNFGLASISASSAAPPLATHRIGAMAFR